MRILDNKAARFIICAAFCANSLVLLRVFDIVPTLIVNNAPYDVIVFASSWTLLQERSGIDKYRLLKSGSHILSGAYDGLFLPNRMRLKVSDGGILHLHETKGELAVDAKLLESSFSLLLKRLGNIVLPGKFYPAGWYNIGGFYCLPKKDGRIGQPTALYNPYLFEWDSNFNRDGKDFYYFMRLTAENRLRQSAPIPTDVRPNR